MRFARSCGLIRGEWIVIDGSKFRAVANGDSVRDRDALRRYLDGMEQGDAEQQGTIDPSAVQAAIEKLRKHPEPEVGFMRIAGGVSPGYNVQTAVDAEHALLVTHAVTLDAADPRCLLPMAEAASQALGRPATLNVVADTGYSNGEHASCCEEIPIYQPSAVSTRTDCSTAAPGRERHPPLPRRQDADEEATESTDALDPIRSRHQGL